MKNLIELNQLRSYMEKKYNSSISYFPGLYMEDLETELLKSKEELANEVMKRELEKFIYQIEIYQLLPYAMDAVENNELLKEHYEELKKELFN